ncbi:MAG: hypothetical protein IPP91_16495 [Betaproteobacteria bacterium]|nr:hypothetical protein [Betaproteobacteria bacterium]
MNSTVFFSPRPFVLAAWCALLTAPGWAADRCAQFTLTLPPDLGGAPTNTVEGGVMKNGKPLLSTSLTCEFTTSKGRVLLHMQNNAKADTVAATGRTMSMSNNGKPPHKLEGVGDEALYSRSDSVMRHGTMLYRAGWKWADRRSNVDLTEAQIKAMLTAVLAATPPGGPRF